MFLLQKYICQIYSSVLVYNAYVIRFYFLKCTEHVFAVEIYVKCILVYCCFFNVLLLTGVVNKIDTCIYCFQADKYSGHELDAFDLFKDFHYSKKMKGYCNCKRASK